MKQKVKKIKRVLALVMAFALFASILPVLPNSSVVVKAASSPSAEYSWTFGVGSLYDASGDALASEVTCQGASTGNAQFKNAEGDVLTVDATSGKFYVRSGGDVQVNTGTKLTFPVEGDHCVVTVVGYSGFSANISGAVSVSEPTVTGSGWPTYTYECVLDGNTSELILTVASNTYAKSLSAVSYTYPKVTVSGTVSVSQGDVPAALDVILSDGTTDYEAAVAFSGTTGTYSVVVPVNEEGTTDFTVSLSDTEYVIAEDTTLSLTADSAAVTKNWTISKLSTVTLSGNISGFDSAYDLSGMNLVFTPAAATDYVPAVVLAADKASYTVILEKDMEYTVSLTGANDYEVTVPENNISISSDSTQDITVAVKPVYAVNVTLDSSVDLTGKAITYVYTNTEDNQQYKFTDAGAIALRNGTYTLTLAGDFEQVPYSIKSGGQITVNGAAVSQSVKFNKVTAWYFYNCDEEHFDSTVQNTVTYLNGLQIDTTSGKARYNTNSTQLNAGTVLNIPVTGPCTITVEAYQAAYALYTINGTAASTDLVTTTVEYTGEAGYVPVVSTSNNAYIKAISLVYPAVEVPYTPQTEMPVVAEDFGTASNMVVQPTGQRLVITQAGGTMVTSGGAVDSSVSYYVFPQTADAKILTFDVVLESCGSSNSNGIFVGAFDGTYIATVAIRNKTGLKGIYSKSASDMAGSTSKVDNTIEAGEKVSFTIEKTDAGLNVSYLTKSGASATMTYPYGSSSYPLLSADGAGANLYYGIAMANATAVITNMKYYAADGTLLYDQNNCYAPEGTAPVATSVTAVASATRDYITVSWEGDDCEDDGKYVLQVSRDGVNYTDVATDIVEKQYQYPITEAGDYYFRVCGILGSDASTAERNTYAVMAQPLSVVAALPSPVVSISSTASSVSVSWNAVDNAVRYEVYRYSYDAGAQNAQMISSISATSYTDTSVTADMPYYYYVVAYSTDNYSNPSDTVWAVAASDRTGGYVYENEAVGITITKKSYDTSFDNSVLIEGVADKACTLTATVNGTAQKSDVAVATRGKFSVELTLTEGRNDVELLFTDSNGKVTRKTYNFVYLTNYDIVVDGTFTGTDGTAVNGIPTYSTVQAAIDSVPASNTSRVVILVKEGSYFEHLQVNKPYVSLIGEDRDATNINYYDATESPEGGDMSKRCAIYVTSAAKGFSAENLTFENDYNYLGDGSKSNESADALRIDAQNTMFINVKLLGYQDTLCANQGSQYFYKCYIAGNVDFIYGNEPRALFNDCELVFRYNANKNSGYVCAPKTGASAEYGLTFYNCQILSEEGCSGSKYLLARPWGADAYITFINTYMGSIVNAAVPYGDMSGNLASEARFFEYYSYGPGYTINESRRQISESKAKAMISTSVLGWDPYAGVSAIGTSNYVGTISTESEDKYIIGTYNPDTYNPTDGDDTGLGKYNAEGYAVSQNISGGGLLYETSESYYKVSTAEEFLTALIEVKSSGKKSVIEITADIGLGSNEVNNFASYSTVIKAYSHEPLLHPTLIESGVSVLMIKDMSNLTIYSKNGSKLLHANIDISGSSNIIIRNLVFDELWEWDEDTEGAYDRNDWDYMTIEKASDNIWIDHCTFYKAYDGVIDIKDPSDTGKTNVTISWCEFLPASSGTFFDDMMSLLEANPEAYPYYSHLINDLGMTPEQVRLYAYGQKKTHLLGQSDDATNAAGIRLTLANNYYKDSMDRMPRLRYGVAHVYNCIMDAQTLLDARNSITNATAASKIVSNGASSTCGAQILLENCYISGIENALNSGNGSSPAGYINAINSLYYMNGVRTKLEPKSNSTTDSSVLITDSEAFISSLPYAEYTLYNPSELSTILSSGAGAGKLSLTTLQWEKTYYYDGTWSGGGSDTPVEPPTEDTTEDATEDTTSAPSETPTEDTTEEPSETPTEGGLIPEDMPAISEIASSTEKADIALDIIEEVIVKNGNDLATDELVYIDAVVEAACEAYGKTVSVTTAGNIEVAGAYSVLSKQDIKNDDIVALNVAVKVEDVYTQQKNTMQQEISKTESFEAMNVCDVYDITIEVNKISNASGNIKVTVSELDMPISIEMKTKKASPAEDEVVLLYTIHENNEPEGIECDYREDDNFGYVTFAADKFSYYILITAKTEGPKIFNNVPTQETPTETVTETQPAEGNSVANTKDSSDTFFYLVLALTAVCGMSSALYAGKKKRA